MNTDFKEQDKVMSTRNKSRLAWLLWALSVVLFMGYIALRVAVSVVLSRTETTATLYPVEQSQAPILHLVGDVFLYIGYLAFSTLGVLIVARHPENRLGWIFCAIGFIQAVSEFASYYAIYALVVSPGSLPGGLAAGWLQNWLIAWTIGLIVIFMPLLFPNGHLLSGRWGSVGWLGIGTIALLSFLLAFYPSLLTNTSLAALSHPLEGLDNPLGIKAIGDLLPEIAPIGNVLLLSSVFAAAVSLILRLRRATGDERSQMKWFAYIASLLVLIYVLGFPIKALYLSVPSFYVVGRLAFAVWRIVTMIIAFLGLPVAAGIAILKYRLYDIDILINRTVVYLTLTAAVIGFYMLIVGGLGTLLQTQNSLFGTVIALLLIAFLFRPLRKSLQNMANRFVPVPQAMEEASMASPVSETNNEPKTLIAEVANNNTLHGYWLVIARIGWVIISSIAFGLFSMALIWNTVDWWNFTTKQCHDLDYLVQTDTSLENCLSAYRAYEQVFGTTKIVSIYFLIGASVEMLPWALVAALIFWRKSHELFALFFSLSLLIVGLLIIDPFAQLAIQQRYPTLMYLYRALSFLGTALLVLWYRFPDGKFVPYRMRWIATAWIVLTFFFHLFPDSPLAYSSWPEPLSLGIPIVFVLSLVFSLIYRYRHVAGPWERQQIRWIVITGAVFGCLFVGSIPLWRLTYLQREFINFPQLSVFFRVTYLPLQYLSSAFLACGIGISILRYRLWDIDILLSRSLVYGALIIIIISLYMIVVGASGLLFQSVGNTFLSILATGLIAVLFHPLRQRLQRGINHLMYGERDDPYAALSRLGRRLESTLAPEAVLPTVANTVREVLKLPYVAIYLGQDQAGYKIVAESASPSLRSENGKTVVPGIGREGLCIPLVHQGETLGYMVLGPRAPNEAFNSTDLRLLDDLAPQVGVAVHAVRLTADLQRSRERLVLAREEERRRLRRDLHDGLGPQLAGLTLKLEAARNRLANDPLADSLLADLAKRTQDATTDIRRLVYELRPPTLDELGLISALREGASQYSRQGRNGVHITIDAPDNLPALPAAVEVAVYRITQEALTNVLRHAEAHTCKVRLGLDEQMNFLCLEIQDDGRGLSSTGRAGVGLSSMRERAEELGGTWTLESIPSVGTRIQVRLPCRLPDEPATSASEQE